MARSLVLLLGAAAVLAGCGATTRNRHDLAMTGTLATGNPAPTLETLASRPDGSAQEASGGLLLNQATYRLAPGDLIDVKFPYHPEENERVPVRPDGRIGLQSAGDVTAAGKTVDELEEEVVARTSRTLKNPVVSVVIVQLAEHKVYVGGDVAKPGFVQYRDGLTPLTAIIERGGFLDTARLDEVLYIKRSGPQLTTQRIDLKSVLEGDSQEQIVMAPDDILFVPKTWIGQADVWVDQWIRGLLPTVPRPGFDLNAIAF